MSQRSAHQIADAVREQSGDDVRTVIAIDDDEWDVVYLRDDLKEAYDEAAFDRAVETFHAAAPAASKDVEALPLGGRKAAVYYHENAFVLQFWFDDHRVLVSVSADAGRELFHFLEECRQLGN